MADNNRTLTVEIFKDDCVGDSSAKHNYNLISLDTNVCNIKSKFFDGENCYKTVFEDFSANLNDFMYFKDNFLHPERYSIASACVNYLSSYWEKHQFTVHYPLNISLVNGWTLNCNTINQSLANIVASAKSFLNLNYPPTSFVKDTVANVIFFLYNVPVNPSDSNDLITMTMSPAFSHTTRVMDIDYVKKSIHFANGTNIKFNNDGLGNWIFLDYTTGTTPQEPDPIPYVPDAAKYIERVPITIGGGRVKIELTITENQGEYDVFRAAVSTGKYAYRATDVILTINKGVIVGNLYVGDGFGGADDHNDGDTVTVINNGTIVGYGGAGGTGGAGDENYDISNAGNGGNAIILQYPTSITNNGIIGGGGGGGAGSPGNVWNTLHYYTKNVITYGGTVYVGGGGGGGAGFPFGPPGGFDDSAAIAATRFTLKGNIWTRNIIYATEGSYGEVLKGGFGGKLTGLSNTIEVRHPDWLKVAADRFTQNTVTKLDSHNVNLDGATGGGLGVDGGSTGGFAGKIALSPLGGKAGNAVDGKGFLTWLTKGTIYGNIV